MLTKVSFKFMTPQSSFYNVFYLSFLGFTLFCIQYSKSQFKFTASFEITHCVGATFCQLLNNNKAAFGPKSKITRGKLFHQVTLGRYRSSSLGVLGLRHRSSAIVPGSSHTGWWFFRGISPRAADHFSTPLDSGGLPPPHHGRGGVGCRDWRKFQIKIFIILSG
jgi:hypothetical protein